MILKILNPGVPSLKYILYFVRSAALFHQKLVTPLTFFKTHIVVSKPWRVCRTNLVTSDELAGDCKAIVLGVDIPYVASVVQFSGQTPFISEVVGLILTKDLCEKSQSTLC